MKIISHRLALALAATAMFISAPSARAGVVTFTGTYGVNWDIDGNWDTGHVPTYADRAVIPSGSSCTVRYNTIVDTLDVEGTLDVAENKTLTLTNTHDNIAGTPDNSNVNGTLTLKDAQFTSHGGALYFAAASHTLTGTGSIVGGKPSTITIGGSFTVTNQLASTDKGIRGNFLTIDGIPIDGPSTDSHFRNEGIVAGVSGGGVTLASYAALEDVEGAQWMIDEFGSFLQFNRGAALNGDITGEPCGTIGCNETVTTCGVFTRNGCYITLGGSGTYFEYLYFVAGTPSCGGNPGTRAGDPSCSPFNGYVVVSSTGTCCP